MHLSTFQSQTQVLSFNFCQQEAKESMISQTIKIKEENKQLRKELLGLIRRTRALHEKRQELEEQHKSLKRDLQYGKDLCRIQGTRQNRLYKSFGITEKLHNSAPKK